MSTASNSPSGSDADSHFTVEDAGSTTDASDLFQNDTTQGAGAQGVSGQGVAGRGADGEGVSDQGLSSRDVGGADGGSSTGADRPAPAIAVADTDDDRGSGRSADTDRTTDTDRSTDTDRATGVDAGRTAGEDRDADADADGTTGSASGGLRSASGDPLTGDDSIGHVFDQTNGMIDRLDGDSDGTAASDVDDAAEPTGGRTAQPIGQQDAFEEDHYGADEGRDPNP